MWVDFALEKYKWNLPKTNVTEVKGIIQAFRGVCLLGFITSVFLSYFIGAGSCRCQTQRQLCKWNLQWRNHSIDKEKAPCTLFSFNICKQIIMLSDYTVFTVSSAGSSRVGNVALHWVGPVPASSTGPTFLVWACSCPTKPKSLRKDLHTTTEKTHSKLTLTQLLHTLISTHV